MLPQNTTAGTVSISHVKDEPIRNGTKYKIKWDDREFMKKYSVLVGIKNKKKHHILAASHLFTYRLY